MRGYQFKSKLTPKQAAEGIRIAKENASDLYEDAKLLYENGRIQRSVSLSILAIEEAGKSRIIKEILLTDDPKELKKTVAELQKTYREKSFLDYPFVIYRGRKKIR